jgi:adenylate cyclase
MERTASIPTEAGAEAEDAFTRALAAERVRSARLANLLRFVGVSLFLGVTAVMAFVVRRPGWQYNDWPLFLAYWLGAGLILALGRRSERIARLAVLAAPLVDMPAVFRLQWALLEHVPNPQAIAVFTTGFFLLLIVATMATLDERAVFLAAAVATALEVTLETRGGADPGARLTTALVILIAAVVCVYVIRRATRLVHDVAREQLRRERLGRYFSPDVAALLAGTPAPAESREVTVLFTDLRDFTAISERLSESEVVALLNRHHTRMVEVLFAFGGTLDKYLGDGLLAYFGAPVPQPDHAERAVRCALAMQAALAAANAYTPDGVPALRMGIGVHTGRVVLGDVGAPRRREYTVVGDTVNVAARLEELTKTTDAPILVSERTRERAGTALRFAPAGTVAVRGRTGTLATFVPLA